MDLPFELVEMIANHLPNVQDICNFSLTSKRMRDICKYTLEKRLVKIILDTYSTCVISRKKGIWYTGHGNHSFTHVDLPESIVVRDVIFVRQRPGLILLIDTNNNLWSFGGRKLHLRLENVVNAKIFSDRIYAVTLDGKIHQGYIWTSEFKVVLSHNVKTISLDGPIMTILDKTGRGLIWRLDTDRMEGINFTNMVSVSAHDNHIIALDNEGQVWGYGSNRNYVLGLPEERMNALVFIPIGPLGVKIVEVQSNRYFTLLRDSEGHYWACGSRHYLEYLGFDIFYTKGFFQLPLQDVVILKAMPNFFVCLKSDHQIWVSGVDINEGNLGLRQRKWLDLKELTPTGFFIDK